ncbi:MAG: hypothetical protein KA288_06300 [Paludibacteraceae bacterium]|jgi:chromatin segregation and condensation protein Rec8/ScpA/Scc1 (kleisin family)|uniref:hypothetical protein n=1 Tax=Acinetobacter colistiniresistens TaxID=280145 RepID=UPI001B50F646|nr:hypothetical protein [Paludibacteraceae bacterium]
MIHVFILFYIASAVLAYNYKKITISKKQVRSASIKSLRENRNYIFATISYSVMLSSLSYFAKVSYTQNNIYEMLLVGSFIAILLISKEDLFSIDGLRQLK